MTPPTGAAATAARPKSVTFATYEYSADTRVLTQADQCRFWALSHYVFTLARELNTKKQ